MIWRMVDGSLWVGTEYDLRDGLGPRASVRARLSSFEAAIASYEDVANEVGAERTPEQVRALVGAFEQEGSNAGSHPLGAHFPASHFIVRFSGRQCHCVFPSDLGREAWVVEEVRTDGLSKRDLHRCPTESRGGRIIASGLTYPEAMTNASLCAIREPGECVVRTPGLFQRDWELENHDELCMDTGYWP